MSQSNIPNITPFITVTLDDAKNLLLSSIAMAELGLSHILNAEGEKIQYILGTLPGFSGPPATIGDVLSANASVRETIQAVTKQEWVLQNKLENILDAPAFGPPGPTGATGATGPTGPTGIGPSGAED